jgi:hypothetical protein
MWQRFGAPAIGIAIALVITAVAYAATRPDPPPEGKVVAAGCAWHGRDVVVTGAVRNPGSSPAYLHVRPTFWIVGLGVRGRNEVAFVHVPADEERAFRYVHRGIAPWRSGMRIGRCFPTVDPVRRGGGGEEEPGGEPGD